MQEKTLEEVQQTIYALVDIVNKKENAKLTRRQAYIAVKVMDLTEGFIRRISDEAIVSGAPKND